MKDKVTIKYLLQKDLQLPIYATDGAAGADVFAKLDTEIVIKPFQRIAVPTGLFLEIPAGYEIQIRPRSGLALKNGITCLNTPGTIDSDYRGEIKIILINLGDEDFIVKNGDRVAQMIISPVIQGEFLGSDNLENTERSNKGFGSTGE